MIKKTLLAILLGGLIVSCSQVQDFSPAEGNASVSRSISTVSAANPLALHFAKAYTVTSFLEYPVYNSEGFVRGFIEVENLGFHKDIAAHYTVNGQTWLDAPATYVTTLEDNKEIWTFLISGAPVNQRIGFSARFALKYTVNGQTYWDNNDGMDYLIADGPRVMFPNVLFQGRTVALQNASFYNTESPSLYGGIVVKDIGNPKTVTVRYTTDGWQSFTDVEATYGWKSSGRETWNFSAPLPVGTESVELAVSYSVNGSTEWDNNYGRNYTIVAGEVTR